MAMRIHESLTEDRLMAAAKAQRFGLESPGFCIACGERHDGVEPDAEKYDCDACGEPKVYGAEQILLYTE